MLFAIKCHYIEQCGQAVLEHQQYHFKEYLIHQIRVFNDMGVLVYTGDPAGLNVSLPNQKRLGLI